MYTRADNRGAVARTRVQIRKFRLQVESIITYPIPRVMACENTSMGMKISRLVEDNSVLEDLTKEYNKLECRTII